MYMENYKIIFIFAYFKCAFASIIYMKLPEVNVTGTNITSHLDFVHIKNICNNRYICKSNNTVICTVRRINDDFEYKNFENSCYLFLSNMCDNPGKEFSIAQAGNCTADVKARRMYVYSGLEPTTTTTEASTEARNYTQDGNVSALRNAQFSTLYEVDTAFDYHVCPLRCPDVYQPVCVSANRGIGKYFKFWTFVNHCAGDLYYCKHWRDFAPPEGEDESINASPLAWSYCGAHRYLQFARFAEATSAMGHYGWLEGDYRYSQILEPYQRKPGYG